MKATRQNLAGSTHKHETMIETPNQTIITKISQKKERLIP
jgi:hypothetical protein